MSSIIKCTPSMLEEILQIEQDSFATPWTNEHFMSELGKSYASFYNLFENGIIGYYILNYFDDSCEIMKIAVAKHHRGKKYGNKIINAIFNECVSKNISKIFLEVNENNLAAVALYKKSGFVKTYERKKYYGNETALLMEKLL